MKKNFMIVFLITLLFLMGCNSTPTIIPTKITPNPTIIRTKTETSIIPQEFTPTPSAKPSPTLTSTPTSTIIPTLNDSMAAQIIDKFMFDNGDCETPCFWELIPGKTSSEEIKNLFHHLGGIYDNSSPSDERYSVSFRWKGSESIYIDYGVKTNTLQYLDIDLQVGNTNATSQNWKAFNLDQILQNFGIPSRVTFFLDTPHEPTTTKIVWYTYSLSYERENFVIQYVGQYVPDKKFIYVCPFQDPGLGLVEIWLGENPPSEMFGEADIDKISNLTIEDFYSLLSNRTDNACFSINTEAYAQK